MNEYDNPECIQEGGTALRVLRGGSWNYSNDDAAVAARNWDDPLNRYFNFGFRVVCAVPVS